MALYPVLGDTLPDFEQNSPRHLTQSLEDGSFSISGIDPDGSLFMAVGLVDKNGNYEAGGRDEFISAFAESVRLTPDSPTQEIELRLVDPEAPGSIEGDLAAHRDTTGLLGLEIYSGVDSTLGFALARAKPDTSGTFRFAGLEPGPYRLVAYCDGNLNGYRDLFEPPVILFSQMRVRPGTPTKVSGLSTPDCSPPDTAAGR